MERTCAGTAAARQGRPDAGAKIAPSGPGGVRPIEPLELDLGDTWQGHGRWRSAGLLVLLWLWGCTPAPAPQSAPQSTAAMPAEEGAAKATTATTAMTAGPMLVTAPAAASPGQSVATPLGEAPRCESACGPSVVALRWQPASGAGRQRVQVALAPSEFVPQAVYESQDLDPHIASIEWRVGAGGALFYWRVVSDLGDGWVVGPAREFQATACHPCDER